MDQHFLSAPLESNVSVYGSSSHKSEFSLDKVAAVFATISSWLALDPGDPCAARCLVP